MQTDSQSEGSPFFCDLCRICEEKSKDHRMSMAISQQDENVCEHHSSNKVHSTLKHLSSRIQCMKWAWNGSCFTPYCILQL